MIVVHGPEWAPLRCPACDGEGELPYKVCNHGTKCPCDDATAVCPECNGRGTVSCRVCGEFDAVSLDDDGDEVCAFCLEAQEAERREAESLPRTRNLRPLLVGD